MNLDIIKLNAIPSTNTYVKDLIKEGVVKTDTVVWTTHQTSGRGQRDNTWFSEPNNSLACSIYRGFSQHPDCWPFMPSILVALAIKKVLDSHLVPAVSIKWPNDIMSYNKKVGGILLENIWTRGTPTHRVIGIGINVNNTQLPDLPKANSLINTVGKPFNIEQLVHEIATKVIQLYANFRVADQHEYYAEFLNSLFRKNTVSTFSDSKNQQFMGIIRGVTPAGLLQVELKDNSLQEFDLKAVKLHY